MLKKKIAILGASGYVGSNLVKILADTYDIVKFSHNSELVFCGKLNCKALYIPSSILGNVDNFDLIVFLLESKNNFDREKICELFMSIAKESQKAKIVFFSTFSVYSDWTSPYVKFKKNIEDLSQNYKNVYIFRPGVIYGGSPGGLYKTFNDICKRSFLVIPAADAVTGYVHINKVAESLLMFCENKKMLRINPLIDVKMSLSEAEFFFGFRGFMIKIPVKSIVLIIRLLNRITNNSIDSLQSLISIIAMKIPGDLKLINSGKIILRKFLLVDYMRINNKNSLKFSIRKFIRVIEESNLPSDYLVLTKIQKYIYMKRLFEIYNLSQNNEI
jgi:hypothetical protein